MKLSRRQKRILKRKLKRIAGDAVAVIVGAGMFVGLFIAWANEPMPDWSEYIEENHIGMVQVEGSDTWLTQEEYEQMCKERDAYETMDVPGIMELHRYVTNELMNEKHNVFMWTIDKYLPQTEEIMSLLGYKLHARLIWDKGNGPAPAYTVRFAHEYLLWFYKKGNIILPDKDKRGAFSTVLRENSKRHHSQKPECAYQMLETFFPQAKKLELFARAERDGWDQWGNEL